MKKIIYFFLILLFFTLISGCTEKNGDDFTSKKGIILIAVVSAGQACPSNYSTATTTLATVPFSGSGASLISFTVTAGQKINFTATTSNLASASFGINNGLACLNGKTVQSTGITPVGYYSDSGTGSSSTRFFTFTTAGSYDILITLSNAASSPTDIKAQIQ